MKPTYLFFDLFFFVLFLDLFLVLFLDLFLVLFLDLFLVLPPPDAGSPSAISCESLIISSNFSASSHSSSVAVCGSPSRSRLFKNRAAVLTSLLASCSHLARALARALARHKTDRTYLPRTHRRHLFCLKPSDQIY